MSANKVAFSANRIYSYLACWPGSPIRSCSSTTATTYFLRSPPSMFHLAVTSPLPYCASLRQRSHPLPQSIFPPPPLYLPGPLITLTSHLDLMFYHPSHSLLHPPTHLLHQPFPLSHLLPARPLYLRLLAPPLSLKPHHPSPSSTPLPSFKIHPMITCSDDGTRKPKVIFSTRHPLPSCLLAFFASFPL